MSFTRHNWSNKTQKATQELPGTKVCLALHWLKTRNAEGPVSLSRDIASYFVIVHIFSLLFFFHSFFPCIFNRYFPMKDVHKKMTLFFFFFPSTETSLLNKPSTQHTMLLLEPGNFQLIWNLPLCFYSHKFPPVWQNQHWSQNLCTQYQVYHLEQIGGANLLVLSGSGNC